MPAASNQRPEILTRYGGAERLARQMKAGPLYIHANGLDRIEGRRHHFFPPLKRFNEGFS